MGKNNATNGFWASTTLDKLLAFAFGVIFAGVLLYLATGIKNPEPLTIRIYVTVLSLAAAGVGAVIPGFIEVRYKGFVRAGGALALFAITYLSEPTIGKNVVSFPEPKTSAQEVITPFLDALSSGKPKEAWAQLGPSGRSQVGDDEEKFLNLYRIDIAPLGTLESRIEIGESRAESPAGAPPGLYRVYSYRTKYANDHGFRNEQVAVRANSDSHWEIYSYQISPQTSSS